MKSYIQVVSSWAFVRYFIRACMIIASECAGVVSRVRTGCLFPQAAKNDCYVYWNTRVKYPERIVVGRGLRVGSECVLGAMGGIKLGDHVRVSQGAVVETGSLDLTGLPPYPHTARPIVVGNGVWICTNAIILGGVTIGEFAVVAAGAVVTRDVPPRTIVAGNPAKVVRERTLSENVE